MRKSQVFVLLVAVACLSFIAGSFGLRRYSQYEQAKIAKEAEIAEQAKLNRQFEAMVAEDSARTEITLNKVLSGQLSTYTDTLGEFDKDVASREKAIIGAKALPQTFSPELRQGFVELLAAENDLANAMRLMTEKERDVAWEQQQAREWRDHLNEGWEPVSTQRIILEHESGLAHAMYEAPVAANSVLVCLGKTTESEVKFQGIASRQNVPYSPTVAKVQEKIRSGARKLTQ
jgi:hypothetical protein